jgi:hypothetical protein
LLRCTAAVLLSNESAESLLMVTGADVRTALPRIKKGIRAAIDFLKVNLNVQKLENLPYPYVLIPLTAFFEGPEGEQPSLTAEQVRILKEWFWRTAFSRRYSSATKRNLEADIREPKKMRRDTSALGNFEVNMQQSFFKERKFISGTVDTKTFILLLANQKPKSIANGTDISVNRVLLAGNKSEFHHLFPQAYLKSLRIDQGAVNCLANFCMLSSSDNKKLGSKKPSEYKTRLANNIEILLPGNLIPPNLFSDDFNAFVDARSKLLISASLQLMGKSIHS